MKKNLQCLSVLLLPLLFNLSLKSQNVGINATGAAPSTDAMLDISATNKGLLIPRVSIPNLTLIGPITGGATTSLLVYNTNVGTGLGYYYWDGNDWIKFTTGGDDWKITGNANTTAGTNFLGTTNGQALDFRTNNTLRFRIANGNQVQANSNGTTGAPFYSWVSDPDIGMFRAGTNQLGFSTAGVERLELGTTEAVFNDISANYDFRIESDAQANMFFVDAGSNEIGIRTAAPTNMLHMTNGGQAVGGTSMANFENAGADGVALGARNTSTASGYNAIEGITDYSGTAFAPAGILGLAIYQGGVNAPTVGVRGATNEWQGVGVQGSRFNSGGIDAGWGGLFLNDLGYTGGVFNASDRRLKKDIESLTGALLIIDKLKPVSYHYDVEKYPTIGLSEGLEYGFIAQEVKQVIPDIVKEKYLPTNGTDELRLNEQVENKNELFFTMDYSRIIPIAIQGIKEQQKIIEDQNSKIEALEKIVLELQQKINK